MYRHINPTRWTSWQYPISCCRYRSSAQHLPLKTSMIHLDAVTEGLEDPSYVDQCVELVTVPKSSKFYDTPQIRYRAMKAAFGGSLAEKAVMNFSSSPPRNKCTYTDDMRCHEVRSFTSFRKTHRIVVQCSCLSFRVFSRSEESLFA